LERRDLIRRQLSLKNLLRESIKNEYKTIDAGDKCYTASDAVRHPSILTTRQSLKEK